MIESLVQAFRAPDIRRKILFTLGIFGIFVFREMVAHQPNQIAGPESHQPMVVNDVRGKEQGKDAESIGTRVADRYR